MVVTAASYEWTTDFGVPAALTNLVVTPDLGLFALDLSVDASADPYHYEYLWESQTADGAWTEIARTTDPVYLYTFAALNQNVRIRVRDSNGAYYSTELEDVDELVYPLWTLAHRDANQDFIAPLLWVQEGISDDLPLDQVSLQPLSDLNGDTQPPIVFTGQWQGDRLSFAILIPADDLALLDTLKRAARQPSGTIAFKDPDGPVYVVQIGALSLSKTDGFVVVSVSATSVA